MDLKSMLNDSAAQRPSALHTPQSSYDARAVEINPTSDSRTQSRSQSNPQSTRPPYPPPLQPVESRGHSAGGYFGFQSPQQNHLSSASTHTSTPSAGPHSAYARSPVAQPQVYTPREGAGNQNAHNASFVPSPSHSVTQPPTPGSSYQYQSHTPLSAHSQAGSHLSYAQAPSPKGSNPTNGNNRQISPNAQHTYSQPATPLGPPINYPKISPQVQRPPSQGLDQHHRRSSYSSVGSAQSKENNIGPPAPQPQPQPQPPSETARSDSSQRQSVPELDRIRERERSISVSPKTVPQPSPYHRQMSASSQAGSHGRLSVQSPPGEGHTRAISTVSDAQTNTSSSVIESRLEMQQTPTPRASVLLADGHLAPSRGASIKQETPEMTSSPAPSVSLKRNASFMSDQSHASNMQPRKRLRRDEKPIFAQSARKKPLRLKSGAQKTLPARTTPGNQQVPPTQQVQPQLQPQTNPPPAPPAPQQQQQQRPARAVSLVPTNGQTTSSTTPQGIPTEVRWESSIADITPFEDLTRRVCDWIFQQIGMAVPPSGGAMFEIEAKIGEIFDVDLGARLRLPVETETIFNKAAWGKTKFESSMNMEQHMLLNKYLNEITAEAFVQAQKGERSEILYDHPHEVDEFFELTPEGRQNLNPSVLQYLNPHHKARVRRTRDRDTGQVKAQIIKSRIADIEIYNPSTDFDCRISISIESPWEGHHSWLSAMSDGHDGRHKDRMSYRHMAYQIDLTQVSHDNQSHMEHELEVEISTEQVRRELDNLQNGRESKYEDLVRGLIDNVRLLCRKGSLRKS